MMVPTNGKYSDISHGFQLVVAGALICADGRVLMHKRPLEKHHGGLWEFPGGKVEPSESPAFALSRELKEELGVDILECHCEPCAFAEEVAQADRKPIVLLLYTISNWTGEPTVLEGGEIAWFERTEIDCLAKPPLDIELSRYLLPKLRDWPG